MKRFRTPTTSLALALGLAAFTGTALAGNGDGNNGYGNGNQPAAATSAPSDNAPGNSASAPGQEKQQAAAQPAAQPVAKSSAPGQAKKAASSASSQPGVKPSSTTKHWTHTTVGASPDVSKRYGNGKTAAQIAASRGAPADTKLTGPGNSQPHKVTACGKPSNKSGGVDVHAVKSYDASGCAPPSSVSALQTSAAASAAAHATGVAPAGSASGTAPAGSPTASTGGVLGAHVTLAGPKTTQPSVHGVLGTVARVAGDTLPFTGLQLWLAVLIAAVLLAGGVLLRRQGHSAARI